MKTEDFMDLLNEVDDKFIQELYEETEFSRPAKKTSRASIVWTRWAAIAAAFALIIISSVVLMKYKSAPTVIVPDSSQHLNESMDSSVVYTDDGSPAVILDINPSIEIKINEENDQVSQLVPLNKDAEELLTNVLMTTTKVNDCVDLLLTELSADSYITPTSNSILVTVVNGDEQQAKHLSDLMVCRNQRGKGTCLSPSSHSTFRIPFSMVILPYRMRSPWAKPLSSAASPTI